MPQGEDFKPFSNAAGDSKWWKIPFYARRLLDFQLLTIYLHIHPFLRNARGTVMDVGCGDGVYRRFLPKDTHYIGMDIYAAEEDFAYAKRADIVRFDGRTIPFPDASADRVLCCEVLEHVSDPSGLIGEMSRVLKPGGELFVTIPWSARYHYIPHDYARYTPSKLAELFAAFEVQAIEPRGSDISVIGNKCIVLAARQAMRGGKPVYWKLPLILLFSPLLGLLALWSLASIRFGWGSKDDPLGYTVRARKAV